MYLPLRSWGSEFRVAACLARPAEPPLASVLTTALVAFEAYWILTLVVSPSDVLPETVSCFFHNAVRLAAIQSNGRWCWAVA